MPGLVGLIVQGDESDVFIFGYFFLNAVVGFVEIDPDEFIFVFVQILVSKEIDRMQ
jgi:hypothetical protein